jgi:hypothetical protein
LANFEMDRSQALALIEAPPLSGGAEILDLDSLSRLLDYGWLSDTNRSDGEFGLETSQNNGFPHWAIFDDTSGYNDDQFSFPSLNKTGRESEWWFGISNEDADV